MINVKFTAANGRNVLEVEGHAELNPGNDTLCAAVSVLVQTLAESLSRYAAGTLIESDIRKGYARIVASEGVAVSLFFNFTLNGLRLLEEKWPEKVGVSIPLSAE